MSVLLGWLAGKLVSVVLPSLGTVIAGYAVVFIKRLVTKIGLQLTAEQEARIRQIIIDAINSVEEKAAAEDRIVPSSEKLDAAVRAVAQQLPDLTESDITEKIHQILPTVRPPKGAFDAFPASMRPGGGRH